MIGDIVLLQPGDIIPSDGHLIEGFVFVDQSSLNGETLPEEKYPTDDYFPTNPNDINDKYLLFRGTVVVDGEGVLVVTRVGVETLYGKVVQELLSIEEGLSPLQEKLSLLADQISKIGYIGATLIAVSFLFNQIVIDNKFSLQLIKSYFFEKGNFMNDLVNSFILGIIVIVVAVPEGLPMMIAIVLSLNMSRLLKDNILVRKLIGIETCGSLSILFSDKTGTMTKGKFSPQLFLSGRRKYHKYNDIPKPLAQTLLFSIINSTESILQSTIVGNSSDHALLAFLKEQLHDMDPNLTKIPRLNRIMFNSERKFSGSEVQMNESLFYEYNIYNSSCRESSVSIYKGAPEIIIPHCRYMYDEFKGITDFNIHDEYNQEIDYLSSKGIRLIAIATSLSPLNQNIGDDLILVGVLGIKDEIRKTTKSSINEIKRAGIQVVMITGDKKEIAVTTAKEINLLTDDDIYKSHSILTSNDLRSMTDEELRNIIPDLRVVARALPSDKYRLVKIAQSLGKVTGMTGDGVNDANALKQSDVSFAMGSGADVAKEASDITIIDDNFSSIVKSILYGRTTYKSIRRFIVFQSTVNLSSMTILFLGPFLGFDFPLTITQLLWINLIMDTLAAIAFGGEPPSQKYMRQDPIKRNEHIISPYMWVSIISNGLFIAFLSVIFLTNDFILNFFVRNGTVNKDVFLTAFFNFFIFITNFNSFNVRTKNRNLFHGIMKNKSFIYVVILIFVLQILFTWFGSKWLRMVPLTFFEWNIVLLSSILIIPFDFFRKRYFDRRLKQYVKILRPRISIHDHIV